MNFTMQPISNQQLTPSDTLQLNGISQNINNNVHHNVNSENNNNHDNYGAEGGDHTFDVQPIEAVYEGNDITEKSNETTNSSVPPIEEPDIPTPPKQTVTRSGRVSRRPRKYDDYVSYPTWMENVSLQATSDPDTLYYHQVLREPDQHKFIEAMEHEIKQHNDNHNWTLVKRSSVPTTSRVLPSVWSMRRKRDLTTGAVMKYKARLNVDGSRQNKGIDLTETFAPVAAWSSIRLILLLAAINNWCTYQLDFVQAFPQAPVEQELYIEVPKGCHVDNDKGEYVLQVLNNIYGQRQAGKVWFDYLTKGLIDK
jgi:Reverse transcriptase (RNA-dependent DNA polymerase)